MSEALRAPPEDVARMTEPNTDGMVWDVLRDVHAPAADCEARIRKAIDGVFTEAEAEDGGAPSTAQGTSAPPVEPRCPQPVKPQLRARQGSTADAPPHAAGG
jgi:hypothetical protein